MKLVFGKNGVELVHPEGNWDLKKGFGFSPVELLVSSVGACGMYVFDGILTRSSIPHKINNVDIEYIVNPDGHVHPVTEITLKYYVEVEEDLRQRTERILALVPKNCPVMQSLHPDIKIIETIHYE